MHPARVVPDEERLVGLDRTVDEVLGARHEFGVDGFHALGREWPRVFDFLLADLTKTLVDGFIVFLRRQGIEHATGAITLVEAWVLGPHIEFGFILGVQVIKVAEELIKTMHGGQVTVAIPQVVLAELAGAITSGLEHLGQGRVPCIKANGRARHPDRGQAGADRHLPGNERRTASGAARLAVVVGEQHAFLADPVDVRGRHHHAVAVDTDIGVANVVTHDD